MAAYIKYLIIYIMILKISIIHGEPNVQSALRNRTRQTTESPSTIYKETPIPPYTPSISSEDRLDLPHTSGSLLVFLQRLNDRLTTMETLQHQQLRKLEGVDYKLTKIEIIIQDKSGSNDKSDNQVIRKLESLEWEINKFGTLIDVIRQDMDKIQQTQMEIKATLASNSASSLLPRSKPISKTHDDDSHGEGTGMDPFIRLQTFSTSMQQTRKATETIQTAIYGVSQNLTDLNNMTRNILSTMNQLVSKQYFRNALKDLEPVRQPLTSVQSSCNPYKGDNLPRDCKEVQETGFNKSGVYRIQPQKCMEPFFAYCDLESDGGGWTIIQRRLDGTINFYQEWLEYKHGFGNTAGEYWLGNDKLHLITNQAVYELRIELEDFDGVTKYAAYSAFAIGSEIDGYMIKLLGKYDGDAGDSFTYHVSVKFSTKDVDNDPWDGGNCAEIHNGGWWYKGCETANLNGQYLGGQVPPSMEYQGVYWYEWHGPEYSLQKTLMKIRPVDFHASDDK